MNHGECWGRAFELPNSPCQGSEGGDTHAKKAGVARNRVGTAARVQQQVAKGQAGHFKDFSFLLCAMGRPCSSVTQLTYASTGSLWLPNWKTERCGGGVRERLLADKGEKQGGQLT